MQNEIVLKVFEGNEVQIITDENDTLLFEIYSTGMALGHVKRNAVGACYPRKERIDENLKSADITPCVHNGHKYINESQLYDFMLEARTDKCKPFRKWITTEVIPSIRKTGSYSIQKKPDSYMIEDPIERAERWIEEQKEKKALENKIEEQKPLVEYAEQIQVSDDVIDMGTMAKIASKRGINIGRNTLFAFLRDRKILNKNNVPYATYMAQDWFEVEENTFRMYDGTVGLSKTTRVTPKGQMAIINQLKKYYMK